MHITTLPVHSKLANAADIRKVFGDRELPLSLSQHQLATYQALCNPDIDVVINLSLIHIFRLPEAVSMTPSGATTWTYSVGDSSP